MASNKLRYPRSPYAKRRKRQKYSDDDDDDEDKDGYEMESLLPGGLRRRRRPAEELPSPVIDGTTSDRPTLLAFMYVRFREKKDSYTFSASFYRRLDSFLFFLPLMTLQCSVAVVYVVFTNNGDFQRLFSGCVSAVSSVLIAIQMKVKFGEMSNQYENGARQYAVLASETFFKWMNALSLTEAEFRDFVRDTGQIEKEIHDTTPVPPAWITKKYERHRMQLTGLNNKPQLTPCMVKPGDRDKSIPATYLSQTPRPPPDDGDEGSSRENKADELMVPPPEMMSEHVSRNITQMLHFNQRPGSKPDESLNAPVSSAFQAKSRLRKPKKGDDVNPTVSNVQAGAEATHQEQQKLFGIPHSTTV